MAEQKDLANNVSEKKEPVEIHHIFLVEDSNKKAAIAQEISDKATTPSLLDNFNSLDTEQKTENNLASKTVVSASNKAMSSFGEAVVDQNGIMYLTLTQLNDIYVESRVNKEQKAYVPYKVAKKYGLTNKSVKAINVNGLIIPIEEISHKGYSEELRIIVKEEREKRKQIKIEQKKLQKNSLF